MVFHLILPPSYYKWSNTSWANVAWVAYSKHCRGCTTGILIFKNLEQFSKNSNSRVKNGRKGWFTPPPPMWQIQCSISGKKKIRGTVVWFMKYDEFNVRKLTKNLKMFKIFVRN